MEETDIGIAEIPMNGNRRRPRPTIGPGTAAKVVAEDASALIRAEVELAKAELGQAVRSKAMGSAAMIVAAVMAWLALQTLLVAAGLALALVVPGWAAALIVAGGLLAVMAVAALVGRVMMRARVSLETTKQNVEQDVEVARTHLARR